MQIITPDSNFMFIKWSLYVIFKPENKTVQIIQALFGNLKNLYEYIRAVSSAG